MRAAERSLSIPTRAVSYGSSSHPDAAMAAAEFHASINISNPACVVFFCCVDYDREALCEALGKLFGKIPVIGCTTAGEICPWGKTTGSIAGFCLSADYFVIETMLIEHLAVFDERRADDMVKTALAKMHPRAIAPLLDHSFALSLLDGMSVREELILAAFKDALPGIPLVGGSAGDNLHFRNTHIYFDNQFYSNAAAIVLVNTIFPFTILSGHHLRADTEKLVVTKADPAKRIAYEFNAEPAALEYCRVMGISLDELNSSKFAMHPLSVQVGDNYYIRSIQQVNDDLSLTFFCAIENGIVLTKMLDGDLPAEFSQRMQEVVEQMGEPQLVIGCDCIHRRIEAEQKDQSEAMSALYRRYKVVGFNTYGEHTNAMHVNHTFTGVAIGGA